MWRCIVEGEFVEHWHKMDRLNPMRQLGKIRDQGQMEAGMSEYENTKRTLRFGVATLQNASWTTLAERWQYLDELGFDSAWVADHFVNPFFPRAPFLDGRFCRPLPRTRGGYAWGR